MRNARKKRSMKMGRNQEPEGIYANTFKVGFNKYEFVLDFGQFFDDKAKEKFHTRIVTSPKHIESLLEILVEALEKYK